MNLFETLIHPDREENAERAEVARAANLLQVGEFQLLQLAYSDWFGRDLAAVETDRLFGAYMMHNQVPHWARHYARHIIGLDAAGSLDDLDPAYHRYDPHYRDLNPHGVRKFFTAATIITLFVGGGIWFSHIDVDSTSQLFPPYVSDKELEGMTRDSDS